MKNIHLFEKAADYDSTKSDLILPTVSYIKDTKDVKYNPFFDANGHNDYVEIAGIKWATKNVGAQSETDYGLYFQWGDTQGYTADKVGTGEGQKKFSDDDYNSELFTKYNLTGKTVLALEDDAVHAAWGGSWRMPTSGDFDKLSKAVDAVWTPNYQGNGVNGLLCTTKDGSNKTLFFPACGSVGYGNTGGVGSCGRYWSSSISNKADISDAYHLDFSDGSVKWQDSNGRILGFAVRGVLGEN